VRIEQLEYLVTLEKCDSLSEASERLFITQQSLGKAIRDLEAELDVALLLRTNKGCSLTAEGHEAVRQAKDILGRVKRLQHYFEKAADTPLHGRLIILCSQVMLADELPLALESFSKQYPDVEVMAMEKDSYYMPVLHAQLLQKDADAVVISILHIPQERSIGLGRISERFQFYPVYRAKWLACMNSRHHLVKQKRISVEALLKENIITSSPDYPETGLDYAMLNYYGTPHVKKIVSNLSLFYGALEENPDYVGLVPNILLRHKRAAVPSELVCREVEPQICSTVGYLVDKAQSNQPIARKFLQHLEVAVELVTAKMAT